MLYQPCKYCGVWVDDGKIEDGKTVCHDCSDKTQFERNGYSYQTLVSDCCYSATEGNCHLSTSIHEVLYGFRLMYMTDESYEDILKKFNKSYDDFMKDVVQRYKQIRRKRRNKQYEALSM